MTPSRDKTYLILTKLHRPPLPPDLLTRSDLGNFFGPDSRQPLTLVCAPAGYGKSTLVAQLIEKTDLPAAWISLDENDSDLQTFLNYLLAAIRGIFPGSCQELAEMLTTDVLPPTEVVAGRLSNDFDSIDKPFILVLDDYHRIRDSQVHEVLNRVLEYPPHGMQFVIATRRNPPLALPIFRGRHILREVRLRDLQFTREQTTQFLERASSTTLKAKTVQKIHEETEGWPVALRLAVLAIRNQEDSDAFIEDFRGGSLRLEEYLLSEVLDQQRPEIRECLLQSSILNRFCAPLCDAICNPDGEFQNPGSQGDLLIQALRESVMPCVPLDEVRDWFRLHHLFQEMLERRLLADVGEQELRALHRRAAQWLDGHGLVEEAVHHYLRAGDPAEAGRVVARHRQRAVNSEQWHRIATWLDQLPQDVVRNDAGLVILLARLYEKQGRFAPSVETMDQAEALLADPKHGGPDHDLYRAWLDQERSIFAYHFNQPTEAIDLATRALESLPEECASERVYAILALAVSYQTIGEAGKGYELVYDALESEGNDSSTYHSRLLQTLCWLHWLEGDLHSLEQAGISLLEVGRKSGYQETTVFGQFFTGAAQYHLNRLDAAEEILTRLASDPYGAIFVMYMSASIIMSLVHEACGRSVQARETVDALAGHMLETGNTSHLDFVRAQQAVIAMRQGRFPEALRWADGFETKQEIAGYYFNFPDIVVARILVDQGGSSRETRTDELLRKLNQNFEMTHNARFLIETLALRSLFESKRNNEDLAVDFLGRAIELAQSGGFIRLFVDMGPAMSRLLNRVRGDETLLKYVGEIQAVFRANQPKAGATIDVAGPQPGLDSLDTLSKRELEVLGLLAQHLTNKEIGSELFIAAETVKRHAQSIYQKLSVGNRKEAVAKATGLGILRRN